METSVRKFNFMFLKDPLVCALIKTEARVSGLQHNVNNNVVFTNESNISILKLV